MRSIGLRLSLFLGLAGAVPTAAADTILLPGAATTGGSGGYSTVLHSQPRSYQVVVGEAELAALPPGSVVTGVQWRLASWQAYPSWPPIPAVFTNFDIYLGKSLNPPGSLSTTYTKNMGPDTVQVRAGQWDVPAGYFPGGAVSPSTNAFCPTVAFSQTYTYTGGDLLLTVRHTGNGFAGSGVLDWKASATGAAQGIGVSSYTQPDQWYGQGNGGLIVMQLEFTPPSACYADCNGDAALNLADFGCFQTAFAQGDPYADCNGDGTLNLADFGCFQTAYALGCP